MFNYKYHKMWTDRVGSFLEVLLFDGTSSNLHITLFHSDCRFCIADIEEGDFEDIPCGRYYVELNSDEEPKLVRLAIQEELTYLEDLRK